jgi:hypothetical protein
MISQSDRKKLSVSFVLVAVLAALAAFLLTACGQGQNAPPVAAAPPPASAAPAPVAAPAADTSGKTAPAQPGGDVAGTASPDERPSQPASGGETRKSAEPKRTAAKSAPPVSHTAQGSSKEPAKPAAAEGGQGAGGGVAEAAPPMESPKPAEPTFTMATVAAGRKLKTVLKDPLSSKTAKVGDRFEVTLAGDLPSKETGVIAIPEGSLVSGEITQARPAKKLKGQALLAFKLDKLTLPSGKELDISASLVSEGKDTTKRSVGGIAGGAAAGALLGQLFGKNAKGTAIGAVAGAAIGTGVVLGMKDKEIELPAGTELSFTLDESIEVPVPKNAS